MEEIFNAPTIVLFTLLIIAFFSTMCYSNEPFHQMLKENYNRIEKYFGGGWKTMEKRKRYPVPQGNLPQNPYGMNNQHEMAVHEKNVSRNVNSIQLPNHQDITNELAVLYQ